MDIIVKSFEDKSPGPDKAWYVVIDEADRKHNLFSSLIPDLANHKSHLQPGCSVHLKKVKNKDNPKFWDTVAVEQVVTPGPAEVKTDGGAYASQDMRNRSISRQSARRDAVTYYQNKVAAPYEILTLADQFYEWETTGIIPVKNIEELKKATK